MLAYSPCPNDTFIFTPRVEGRIEGDQVVACEVFPADKPATLITVCAHGYGKRTATTEYPTKGRGGFGVITIKTTERNGKVVGLPAWSPTTKTSMLITDGGKVIRIPVKGIPTLGRNTQGVRLVRVASANRSWPSRTTGRARGRGRRGCRRTPRSRSSKAREDLFSGDDDEDDLGGAEGEDDDKPSRRPRRGRRNGEAQKRV